MLERGLGVQREVADGRCSLHRLKDNSQLALRRSSAGLLGFGRAVCWPGWVLSLVTSELSCACAGPRQPGLALLETRRRRLGTVKSELPGFPGVAVLRHGLWPHHLRSAFPRG